MLLSEGSGVTLPADEKVWWLLHWQTLLREDHVSKYNVVNGERNHNLAITYNSY